mmetsp:Transcript_11778/g.38724  ORF Transcript_11778/g.38724 Transcript_11778/m.38724 type:complete len:238 (+) Transcript_11778:56-769(+)
MTAQESMAYSSHALPQGRAGPFAVAALAAAAAPAACAALTAPLCGGSPTEDVLARTSFPPPVPPLVVRPKPEKGVVAAVPTRSHHGRAAAPATAAATLALVVGSERCVGFDAASAGTNPGMRAPAGARAAQNPSNRSSVLILGRSGRRSPSVKAYPAAMPLAWPMKEAPGMRSCRKRASAGAYHRAGTRKRPKMEYAWSGRKLASTTTRPKMIPDNPTAHSRTSWGWSEPSANATPV